MERQPYTESLEDTGVSLFTLCRHGALDLDRVQPAALGGSYGRAPSPAQLTFKSVCH